MFSAVSKRARVKSARTCQLLECKRRKHTNLEWSMSSVWPEAFVNNDVVRKLTSSLTEISGGSWKVNVKYGVNKNTAFDDAKSGKVHMTVGHSTYWPNMKPASAFFASIPFGLGHAEFSAWISFGGGRKYWEELYAPHGLYPLPAGDTGMQMGGWFAKEINNLGDFKGLRMRIEGLGGPVLEKHGVKLVDAPASKLVGLLSSRELDACEFATPAMDEAAGLHKVVPKLIYHYPGWHQPSAVFEFLVNQNVWKSLTQQQQALLTAASHNASTSFTESLLAKNQIVLERMISEHSVKMHKFPDSLLQALKKDSEKVLAEHCAGDKFSLEVMESYLKFLKQMEKWGPMSSAAMWQWRK